MRLSFDPAESTPPAPLYYTAQPQLATNAETVGSNQTSRPLECLPKIVGHCIVLFSRNNVSTVENPFEINFMFQNKRCVIDLNFDVDEITLIGTRFTRA